MSDSSALHCEIASSGTRCSSFKLVMLVTLGGYHLLMAWWWSPSKHARKITRCYGEVIVRGVVLAPWEPRRGTLVVRVIELPSLQVGSYSALAKGLTWCKLAHKPPK